MEKGKIWNEFGIRMGQFFEKKEERFSAATIVLGELEAEVVSLEGSYSMMDGPVMSIRVYLVLGSR